MCARSEDKLAALVKEIGSDQALALHCDVTDFSDQQRMVESVLDHYGRIDAVFANAGTGVDTLPQRIQLTLAQAELAGQALDLLRPGCAALAGNAGAVLAARAMAEGQVEGRRQAPGSRRPGHPSDKLRSCRDRRGCARRY